MMSYNQYLTSLAKLEYPTNMLRISCAHESLRGKYKYVLNEQDYTHHHNNLPGTTACSSHLFISYTNALITNLGKQKRAALRCK